jgi:hydrogenase maturation protease
MYAPVDKGKGSDVILIGIGNEFRSDDFVGIMTVREIKEQMRPEAQIIEESGEGSKLMEAWNDAKAVVLIDAISSHATPGTISRIDLNEMTIPKNMRLFTTHAFGVAQAVELARGIGSMPAKIILFGIEGKNFSLGFSVSSEVRSSMKRFEQMIIDELNYISSPGEMPGNKPPLPFQTWQPE